MSFSVKFFLLDVKEFLAFVVSFFRYCWSTPRRLYPTLKGFAHNTFWHFVQKGVSVYLYFQRLYLNGSVHREVVANSVQQNFKVCIVLQESYMNDICFW